MFFNVLKFQFKNSIKVVRNTFILYLVVFSLLTAACAAVSFLLDGNGLIKKIQVAVVKSDDDAMTDMIIRYVSQMDSIKQISDFNYYDRETAFDALQKKEVRIILDLPDDFYNSVNSGDNLHLNVYILNDDNIVTKAFAKVLYCGVNDVAISEATVYSFLYYERSDEYELKEMESPLGDYIAEIFMDVIMHRTRLFSDLVMSEFGDINVFQYYFATILVVFIFFVSSGFNFLYRGNSKAVSQKLRMFGIHGVKKMMINNIIVFAFCFFGGMVLYLGGCFASKHLELDIIQLSPSNIVFLMIVCLSVSFIMNALFTGLGVSYMANGTIFCLLLVLFAISGSVIPLSSLPKICSVFNTINPIYYLFKFEISSFYGNFDIFNLLVLVFIGIICNSMVLICEK